MNSILKFLKNEEVKEYELGEVCEIVRGISLSSKHFKEAGTPVLKVKNIQNNKVQEEGISYCDLSNFPKAIFANPGDVLIANGGSTSGKVGINSSDKKMLFTTDIFKLAPNPEILDRKYLYHFLLNCSSTISSFVTKGIIPHLYKSSLEKLKISVPSLEAQRRITSVLDKFDEIEREIDLRQKQYEYYREFLINTNS